MVNSMKYLVNQYKLISYINNDEYLLLSLKFNKQNDATRSLVEYSFKDESVLDICFDYETNIIDGVDLVIADKVQYKDINYECNQNVIEGCISIDTRLRFPLIIETNMFYVNVFRNAVVINIGDEKEISNSVRIGDVIFSLNNAKEMVQICVLNIDNKVIGRLKMEKCDG